MLHVSWYCKHNGECERDLVDTEVESLHQEGDNLKEVQCLQSMLKVGEIVLMVGDEKNNGERKKGKVVHLPHPS